MVAGGGGVGGPVKRTGTSTASKGKRTKTSAPMQPAQRAFNAPKQMGPNAPKQMDAAVVVVDDDAENGTENL